MLNTTIHTEDGELMVALEGRLDALSSQNLEKELEAHFDGIKGITIDCTNLEYISSAGLRTILAAEQYLEEKGLEDVRVINANSTIKDIFEETGFIDLVNFVK